MQCYLLLTPRDFGGSTRKSVDLPDGGSIMAQSGGMYVLGNIFLTNYYAIYDVDNQRIGLTPAKDSHVLGIEATTLVALGKNDLVLQVVAFTIIMALVTYWLVRCR